MNSFVQEPKTTLSIRLTPELEWRIWPVRSPCLCDDPLTQTGTRWSFPFFSIWVIRSKESSL